MIPSQLLDTRIYVVTKIVIYNDENCHNKKKAGCLSGRPPAFFL
ncbi:hypothetical protein D3OALGA1CA_2681 [Olavius algarvensis associated proteobacterium Delta 3]|nr:hypothetical protein D3OALGA1CA_2681 [Olavius algarvensis associated proteobacterium Delta 3]